MFVATNCPIVAIAPNGCQATDTVTVVISTMTATATRTANTGSACAPNGSVNLTVQNGLSPLSFVWSNGATTEDLSSIAAGTYQVTVTDGLGCTKTLPGVGVAVTGTKTIALLSVTYTEPKCFGGTTGSRIKATFTGGKKPYSYAWSNGTSTADPTNFISNVPAGTYSVTLTDAQGCTFVQSNLVLEQPDELVIEGIAVAPDPARPGRFTATFSVSGGTPHLTGAAYRYTRSFPTGFGVNNPITNIAPGTYIMAVRDRNLCTDTQTVTVGGNKPSVERGEQTIENQLLINPNPVRETLNLSFEMSTASLEGELTIFDIAGRNWFEQALNLTEGETFAVMVKEFPAGIYQAIFVTTSGERFQKSFSIVH